MSKYAKLFLSVFKPDNHYFLSVIFFLSLTLCRLFSNLTAFHYSQIMIIILIFLEFLFLFLCIKYKNGKLKKSFSYFIILAHILLLYLIPFIGSEFFQGIEASIIFHQNFKKIPSKITRIFFLFVSKDFPEFDFNSSYLVYYLYTLVILEHIFCLDAKITTTDPSIEKQASEKSKDEPQVVTFRRLNSAKKGKEISHQNSSVSCPSISMVNLINIGIARVNNELNITFANNYLFDLFHTHDLTKIKDILFNLDENIEIQQSDFQNIPDFDLPKFFHKSCIFGESMGSFRIDEHNESPEQLKSSMKLPIFSKYLFQSMNSMQDDVRFENWKKRYLNENLQEKFVKKTGKKPSPKSVLKYLVRLNDYCTKKSKAEIKQTQSEFKSDINLDRSTEHENYSMFANLVIGEDEQKEEKIILINFIPLKVEEETIGKPEILISFRTLSDMELKYIDYNNAKNRILGSFCHELRTPINA